MADNFDINYETLKEFYEAVKDESDYEDSILEEFVDYGVQELNKQELDKKLGDEDE